MARIRVMDRIKESSQRVLDYSLFAAVPNLSNDVLDFAIIRLGADWHAPNIQGIEDVASAVRCPPCPHPIPFNEPVRIHIGQGR
eukprot:CAMPEP_0113720948 /NCGR_PEP_ID=MMETSP0038_2-20120614/36811_1 /TAXON_ID=2898 /ORGANISM="Cryptomonas paramecium" /LENGTH=83 /DNA_ID=CAMNT_0000649803 /DNA_START=184 /DNA_END=431 /DNA_ORIENTATION=- /assembly_acc=CAM_ASM_000170